MKLFLSLINNAFAPVEDQASKLRHFLELATSLAFHESLANTLTQKKELKSHKKGTHRLLFGVKKSHKNNAVRFTQVLAVGTR